MAKPTPITINGKTYSTHHEAAKALGISNSALTHRLQRNPETVGRPAGTISAKYWPIIVDGKKYYETKTLSKQLDMSQAMLRHKIKYCLKHNLPLTRENLKENHSNHICEVINGKTYYHIKDISRDFHVNISTLNARYTKHHLHGQELIKPAQKRNRNGITLNDQHFKSLADAARYYHINYSLFTNRFYRYQQKKINFDQLIKPVMQSHKPITIGQHHFKSQRAASRYYQVKHYQFLKLIDKFNSKEINENELISQLENHKTS